VNYLTNCEIALVGIKNQNPHSIVSTTTEFTRSPKGRTDSILPRKASLFEELIKKHSNENDVVLDTFLGAGTTAIACKNTKRRFRGCELSTEYFDKIKELI
jgi:DNA modification methylase